jgi:hypothetical protein
MHMTMMLAALDVGLPAFEQGVPLVGGTRQRLGVHSRRWSRQDRSRSPRASGVQGGHDAGQSHVETGEAEFRRYVSGLYMEKELLPLCHNKSVTRQVALGQWEFQIWANVELLANGEETLPETCG